MSASVTIDSRQFRNALGTFTTGVTIVTTCDQEGRDVGLTANSFNSVSLDPPLVLWSLAKTSRALGAFIGAEYFAVHVLAADQEPLSNLFAKSGADKFAGMEVTRGEGNVPLLEGSAARFQCRTKFRYDGGDHEIFIGEVVAFDHYERAPLAFHAGGYGLVMKAAACATRAECDEVSSSFSMDFLGYLLGAAYVQLSSQVRREIAKWELDGDEYWLLNLLARFDNRRIRELDAMFAMNGRQVSNQLISGLIKRGLVEPVGEVDRESRVHLTDAGRQTMIEVVAAAKAVELNLEKCLDYGQSQMLKQLLRQLVNGTNTGPPPGWGE